MLLGGAMLRFVRFRADLVAWCRSSDDQLIDACEYSDEYRASGDCFCGICGYAYREHRVDLDLPFLHVLCNQDRVKL